MMISNGVVDLAIFFYSSGVDAVHLPGEGDPAQQVGERGGGDQATGGAHTGGGQAA
jgi:hypothetical protein